MNKIILVIEDNAYNMELMVQILEYAGFDIVQAKCAEDGLQRLQQGGIDLVLMDISLPVMDGLEAARTIKSDESLKTIPVMGLSSYAMQSDREAALEAGCDDYQTKPIDEDALLLAINRLLN